MPYMTRMLHEINHPMELLRRHGDRNMGWTETLYLNAFAFSCETFVYSQNYCIPIST